jgi:hypothetical protein
MKSSRNYLLLTACLLMCSLSASAQTPAAEAKQLVKDGLTFSYPTNWSITDTSNVDSQQFTLGRPNSEAQIRVFVFRTPVQTPERLAEARKVLVDPYITSTTKAFQQMGARPQSAPAATDIGTLKAEGVRISASLSGEPGAAEIYWGVVGQRLVVLTLFGPDNALKQAAPAWDMIRTSIAVEEPKPAQPKTTATPKTP